MSGASKSRENAINRYVQITDTEYVRVDAVVAVHKIDYDELRITLAGGISLRVDPPYQSRLF